MSCPISNVVCRGNVSFFYTFKYRFDVVLGTFNIFHTNLTDHNTRVMDGMGEL